MLVGRATTQSVATVLGELADAHRMLSVDDVGFDVVLVTTDPHDAAAEAARSTARRHGLSLRVRQTQSRRSWEAQREALADILRDPPDFIATLDSAGHHDARQLPALVTAFAASKSGITIGSRWIAQGTAPSTSPARRALSRLASRLVATATGLRRLHDTTTSFRVLRPDAAQLITANPVARTDYGAYCEYIAVAQAYGFEIGEVPISYLPRFATVVPLRPRDLIGFTADLRRIRRRIRFVRSEMKHDQEAWSGRSARLRRQGSSDGSEFGALEELNVLSTARRFHRWIIGAIEPCLGSSILEVGAGYGAMSRALAERPGSRTVVAIEPAANVFPTLRERCDGVPNLVARQMTSTDLVGALADGPPTFDTVVYVNVLEHVEDDVGELRTALQLTRPGGALALFVPAMPSLYGSLDFKSGHYRRYTSDMLRARVEAAGFVVESIRYLDMLGVVPYWMMYRVFDVRALGSASSQGYDRVIVPASRAIERLIRRPPFGKNLVVKARRPA